MKKNRSGRTARQQLNRVIGILAVILIGAGIILLCFRMVHLLEDFSGDTYGVTADTAMAAGRKKVLYLCSYSPTFISFDDQKAGISRVLEEENVSIDTICMDSKKYGTASDLTAFHAMMEERFAGGCDYDGIIASDDNAAEFCYLYGNELFPGVPIVYFGVNRESLAASASELDHMAGYLEEECIREVVTMAKKLQPKAERVLAVSDNTATGRGHTAAFIREMEKYFPDMDYQILNFSLFTKDTLKDALQNVGEDTILLNLSAYRDAEGNYYSTSQQASLLSSASDRPVYYNATGGYNAGYTAGAYMDFGKAAAGAASLLIDIMDGKTDIASLTEPLHHEGVICYACSFPKMMLYGFDIGLLPGDTVVVGKPNAYWTIYRGILVPALIILAGLFLLVIYVRNLGRTAKKREITLGKSLQSLEKSKEHLRWSSEHDYLTGLPDRHSAMKKLTSEYAENPNAVYAVALIDIDNFKTVNEMYGHENGDEILKTLTERLGQICRGQNQYLCRYGGDEFMIVFWDHRILSEEDPDFSEIWRVFLQPVRVGNDQVVPSSSAGIANAEPASTMEEVIIHADIALNQAKKNGKNMAEFYTKDMRDEVNTLTKTKAAIVDAVTNDGFRMVYQPKVCAATGEVVGYEALVRMKSGSLSPGIFIPAAESSGWIRAIGRITTEQVVRQLSAWQKQDVSLRPVSLNFSTAQLGDRNYVPFLKGLLDTFQVDPKYIEIEITESLFMGDSAQAKNLLNAFQGMGMRLLMDDFGKGYSSLSYLTYLPIDVIKIDKSLVDTYLVEGQTDFIRDVITLAHDLGKEVIAEGVETREQFLELRDFGCDTIQGYYFAKPMDPDQVPAFTKKREKTKT